MAKKTLKSNSVFIYNKDFVTYQFGRQHPFNPLRVKITYDLLNAMGALEKECIVSPKPALESDLLLAHSKDYIDYIKDINNGPVDQDKAYNYGVGTEDIPIFDNMHQASSLIAGATLCAVNQVMEGKSEHALNLIGGLHHALYGKGSGFCVYNDIVIAIQHILRNYNKKVLYIDTDAHHGDGVQWAFYDDPNVCTISIHETGKYIFPGTGAVHERGTEKGYSYTFNIPLEPFTEDDSFIKTYTESFEKIVEYFKPDIIISQNGSDSHAYDPLTHLMLSMKSYEHIPKLAHKLAHKYCDGKWVALGGGGYDIFRVVPRAWAWIWLEMIEYEKISKKMPTSWLEKWQPHSHYEIPTDWDDPNNLFEPIPRKGEIDYTNKITLRNALYSITKEIFNRFFDENNVVRW